MTSGAGVVLLRAGLIIAVAGFCWVAAGLRPFTSLMYAVVAASIAGVGALAWRNRDGRVRPRIVRRDAAAWVILLGLLAVVETEAYLSSPRAEHPTLSSMVDAVMDSHPGRTAVFALWLLGGWAAFAWKRRS